MKVREASDRKRNIPAWLFVFLCVLVLLVIVACIMKGVRVKANAKATNIEMESETVVVVDEDAAFKEAFSQVSASVSDNTIPQETTEILKEESTENIVEIEKYSISNISAESLISLADVYSEARGIAEFQCYYPDATSYTWEVYDLRQKKWVIPEQEMIQERIDELVRNISVLQVEASKENHERMVRCSIERAGGETITETASLYILDIIEDISVEDFETDGNRYVHISEIPVKVTYTDGTTQIIRGLNHFCFLDKTEFADCEECEDGNKQETITTVITEQEQYYLELDEKEVMFRYDKGGEESIDFMGKLLGKDYEPPIIENVQISPFEISSEDRPIPVVVTIIAEDNGTPYPQLEYAFVPEGQEPTEEDWKQKNKLEIDITQNGIWEAYCRDLSGNYITAQQEVIAVDQKVPELSIMLEQEAWCMETRLLVHAEDVSEVSYCYTCEEAGIDSGWVADAEYMIKQNGNWQVQAKDSVGNISSQEIRVTNIDRQAPVILSIEIKENNE